KYVIKTMTKGDRSPLIGVEGLVRPVKARLFLEQIVGKGQLDLPVTSFVQRSVQGHVAPRRGTPKPAHSGLADGGQVLRHGDPCVVRDDRGFPARVQVLENPRPGDGRADGVDPGILRGLVMDVLTVADLVRLIPAPPSSRRYTMA